MLDLVVAEVELDRGNAVLKNAAATLVIGIVWAFQRDLVPRLQLDLVDVVVLERLLEDG